MSQSENVGASADAALHRVGSLAEVRAGKRVIAKAAGQWVAVFATEDAVVATQGRCPHASGPLHEGEVEGHRLTCPWHGWSFDLRNGECEEDPELFLHRYEVVLSGDDILVRL
jgi:nitrite reductase/ring-hydroxylating ferredoxin subunit